MKDADDLARGWFAKAESDLLTARALAAGPGPYDTVCFHSQQAIEKAMKGYLARRGIDFPFTHDLDELAMLCDRADPALNLQRPEVIALTDYAVRLRYDNDFWPSEDDAQEALKVAESVYEMLMK